VAIYTLAQLQPQIDAASAEYSVPSGVLSGILQTESGLNSNAISAGGRSVGLAQFVTADIPSDERSGILPSGFSQTNVGQNITGAAALLASDIHRTGSLDSGIEAYNNGSGVGDSAYLDKVYQNSTASGQSAIENGLPSSLSAMSIASTPGQFKAALSGVEATTPIGATDSGACPTVGIDPATWVAWASCNAVNLLAILFGIVLIIAAIFAIARENGVKMPSVPIIPE